MTECICHGIFQTIHVQWLTFFHPCMVPRLEVLVTLPLSLYGMYFACADPGTSFDVKCHQALLRVVMYYIITKYLAGGIHVTMTLCVPLLDPTGPYKGQIPWHGTVLWLHANQGVTLVSWNLTYELSPWPILGNHCCKSINWFYLFVSLVHCVYWYCLLDHTSGSCFYKLPALT